MELKEGYKQTEVGMIPTEWDCPTLNELGTFFKGKGIKKDEVLSEGYPCVRYGELYTLYDSIIKETKSFISSKISQNSYKLKYGDLLFAGSGETKEEIGKSAVILRSDAYAGGDIVILRPNSEIVEFNYLGYVSNSNQVNKQKSKNGQGDAVVHIYSSGLLNVIIPLPPLPEQTAIATVLSDTDQLIQAIEKKIAKKRLIKQGAMQELLRPKEGWEERKLGEVVYFLDGQRKPIKANERKSGIYPYYGASGIIDYVADYIFDDELILLGEDGENILSRNLPLAFKVKGKIWVNNHAHVLKPKQGYDITFLTEYLESLDYTLLNSGTAQPKLNKQACINITLSIPKIIEQRKIATILSNMDSEIITLENQLTKYKELKQGLMQNLLTGKIRLV